MEEIKKIYTILKDNQIYMEKFEGLCRGYLKREFSEFHLYEKFQILENELVKIYFQYGIGDTYMDDFTIVNLRDLV